MSIFQYPDSYCDNEKPKKFNGTRLCDILSEISVKKIYNNLEFYLDGVKIDPNDPTLSSKTPEAQLVGYDIQWKISTDPPLYIGCDVCDAMVKANEGLSRQETQMAITAATVATAPTGAGAAVQGTVVAVNIVFTLLGAMCRTCDLKVNNAMILPATSIETDPIPTPTPITDPISNEINPPVKKMTKYKLSLDTIITGLQFNVQYGQGISRLMSVIYCPVLQTDDSINYTEEGPYTFYRADSEVSGSFLELPNNIKIRRSFRINNNDTQMLGNFNQGKIINILPLNHPDKAFGLRGIAFNINQRGKYNITDLYLLFTSFWTGESIVYYINNKTISDPPAQPESAFPSNGSYLVYIDEKCYDKIAFDINTTNKRTFIRDFYAVGSNYNEHGGFKGFYGVSFVNLQSVYENITRTGNDIRACCTLKKDDAYSEKSLENYYCNRNRYITNYNSYEPQMSQNCINTWSGYCTQERFEDKNENNECKTFCGYGYTDCDNLINNYCSKYIRKVPYVTITSTDNVLKMIIFDDINKSDYKTYDLVLLAQQYSLYGLVNELNSQVISKINPGRAKPDQLDSIIAFSFIENNDNYYLSISSRIPTAQSSTDNEKNTIYNFNLLSTNLSIKLGFDQYTKSPNVFLTGNNKINDVTIKSIILRFITVNQGDTIIYNNNQQIIVPPGVYKFLSVLNYIANQFKSKDIFCNVIPANNLVELQFGNPISILNNNFMTKLGFVGVIDNKNYQFNPDIAQGEVKNVLDYKKLDKDPICSCYIGGEPMNDLNNVDSLSLNDKRFILPYDSLRLYLYKKMKMASANNKSVDKECILPKCRYSKYKYKNYKNKINNGTFSCPNELNCVSDGGFIDYNLQSSLEGDYTNCIKDTSDLTKLKDEVQCKNPYIPDIFVGVKPNRNCLSYLAPEDKDCIIEDTYSLVGKCGQYQPNKQRFERRIKKFNIGNGKLCPPLRDRSFYKDCIPEPEKTTVAENNSIKYWAILLILVLVLLFIGLIYFLIKKYVL